MVLTEEELRVLYKQKIFKEIEVGTKDILTPSARQFLKDNNIKIIKKNIAPLTVETQISEKPTVEIQKSNIKSPKFKGLNNEYYFEKKESLTQLYGNTLVSKTHPRIKLRGQLDLLYSKFIILNHELKCTKNSKLYIDLKSISTFINTILLSEIIETPLDNILILNETLDKIKELSHNPKKYFGVEHLFNIDGDYDYIVLKLNELRSFSRVVEISAIEAFKNEQNKREDILTALNRLSSAIYVMMLKSIKGEYKINERLY